MNLHIKYASALIIMAALVYLTYPPTPLLQKAEGETLAQYDIRYEVAQAKAFLYETKYIGQRWRGLNWLDDLAASDSQTAKQQALLAKFEYFRYHGQPKNEWLNKSWREPLPRPYLEKAINAAEELAETNKPLAADLLAELIVYPVTVPVFSEEAVNIVRDRAEAKQPMPIFAMITYCTDDRFDAPCDDAEKQKWKALSDLFTESK